jgi:hypothetical protein
LNVKRPDRGVVGVGGIAVLLKQKKPPDPSQPLAFRPPGWKRKPVGEVIVPAMAVPGDGSVNARAWMPVRPPSVSEAVFSPLIVRVKNAVRPFELIEFSVSVYVMPSATRGVVAEAGDASAIPVKIPAAAKACFIAFPLGLVLDQNVGARGAAPMTDFFIVHTPSLGGNCSHPAMKVRQSALLSR